MTDYLDGPRFTAWVRERHPNLEPHLELGNTLAKRWKDWEAGGTVYWGSADKVLTRLGQVYSLGSVPDDLWVPDPDRRRRITAEDRAAMREMFATRTLTEVARHFGVDRKTVKRVVAA